MVFTKRFSLVFIAVFFLFAQIAYSESDVPEGLIVKDGYEHGVGASVGTVQLVQGTVLIIHIGDTHGYLAQKDVLLFKGDTIITRENGRISFRLNDGSILTLTTGTKLVINESIYDPSKESRSAFISMTLGKARFWIKKIEDFKHADFKVKTQTAVVGVRGSDFIIEAGKDFTKVTALENTQIEVVSLSVPCEDAQKTAKKCKIEPVTLTDFEQAIVNENALPVRATEVLPEESERIKKEFLIKSEDGQIGKKDSASSEHEVYLVPTTELVAPESANEAVKIESAIPEIRRSAITSISKQDENIRQETAVSEQQQKASETQLEKAVISELPGFPKEPRR